ncbi:four helix bundle protein [Paracrocinitomix mangrovi]|uniref:four helix bundle protein n=1 Tax=Paracrocinitomix mangrovi TaxID=2862509 RepID=UPI001C8E65DC|nr:four helix bundle protein [Paracrocinitomix mangrovi]UKN01678.1 four helix bundle protein [Paracrocinitomix mangrovi]
MKQTFNGPIDKKSFYFAIDIVNTYKHLVKEEREFVLSKQLLRSGTAVGALSREAQNAESIKDFIHKYHIAQKECDETIFWIQLLTETGYLKAESANNLHYKSTELLRMIKSAILTAKSNLAKR